MKIRMRRLQLFILLFAASSLLFQLPSEAFASTPSDITAAGTIQEYVVTSPELHGAHGVSTFTIDGSTYAIVASYTDDGVQIIDISDPDNIVAKGYAENGVNSFSVLDGPRGVDTFVIGDSTYAIVAVYGTPGNEPGSNSGGVQIIDISDPDNIVAKASATRAGALSGTSFSGGWDVDTFTIGDSTYAIATGYINSSVVIIDISNPAAIVMKDHTGSSEFNALSYPNAVDTFVIGDSTYAIITSVGDDGVWIIDISDPEDMVLKDSETDEANSFDVLDRPEGVDTFVIGDSTYAIVASSIDDGVQIIDISDPDNIVAKASETDEANSFDELDGARSVSTFTIGESTYAIVASHTDDGVQIIDISDPDNIVAKASATDGVNSFDVLDGAIDVETFTIDGNTYAIVVANTDDGVQIIELNTDTTGPTVTITSSTGDSGDSTSSTTLSYTATFNESVSNFVVGDITVTGTANDGSPAASNFAGSGTTYTFDVVQGSSDGTVSVSVAAGKATDAVGNSSTVSNTYTFTIDTSVAASDTSDTSTASTGGTCSRHVILGNCGTIAINNDEYRIINTWTNVPTTEVLVGQPVTVTLSTPNNPTHTKIHFASVHTEVFSIPANFDHTAHIDYSIMNNQVTYVSQSQLFQVAGGYAQDSPGPRREEPGDV